MTSGKRPATATTEQPDYTWREITWMETLDYEIRRFGGRLTFRRKTRDAYIQLAMTCMVGALVTLGLAIARSEWGYDLPLDPPVTVEFWLFQTLMLGGLALALYVIYRWRRRKALLLYLDLDNRQVFDGRGEFLAPFEAVHVEHVISFGGWNDKRLAEGPPYHLHRYWLRSAKKRIEFYFTTHDAQDERLRELLTGQGLRMEDIRTL